MEDLDRFRGLLGVAAILGAAWWMSENRRAISARMVIGGLAMQTLLGFGLVRFEAGRTALDAAGRWVESVLACAEAGARFVFGDRLVDPAGPAGFVFAFRVLPTIVFAAALFAVLYHLGVMQVVVRAFAWVTARVLGSSGAETLNAAASIFLGQTEAPLVIRPYLSRLTRSELAVVMVSGMGLVSGGILGAYLAAGCASRDLLTAILMSFPATIYLTKIVVPETGTPETLGTTRPADERIDRNVLDAAARGTREGLMLAANVAAMLISFTALVALVNMGLAGLGGLLGYDGLSLQGLLGLALEPLAWLLGVPRADCRAVGGLLGTRTVLNELVAYGDLGRLKDALTPKAFALATIALCGFANISSIGIQLGGIGALIPERRAELAQLAVKVLVISTLANFLSAAIASVLLG
jgi:CNT family concentrative nucleoside transporter